MLIQRWQLSFLPNLQPQPHRHLGKGAVTADQSGIDRNCMGCNHHVEIAQADALGFQSAAKLAMAQVALTCTVALIPSSHSDKQLP